MVRRVVNEMLQGFARAPSVPTRLPTQSRIAEELGVSRFPVSGAVRVLLRKGLVRRQGQSLDLVRRPRRADYYALAAGENRTQREQFESAFLEMVSQGRLRPGAPLSESGLARGAGVNTATVREVLASFGRLGVIEKLPRRRWRAVRFTDGMIDELMDLRQLLEEAALRRFVALPRAHPLRSRLEALRRAHLAFAGGRGRRVQAFWSLDTEFHKTLFDACANRYFDEMFATISLLIRFQLRQDELGRRGMAQALEEHAAIMAAALKRDEGRALAALRRHLEGAREILKLAAAGDASRQGRLAPLRAPSGRRA